jgi:hypothetical protein
MHISGEEVTNHTKGDSAVCTKYEQVTKDKAVKHHQRQGRIKQPSSVLHLRVNKSSTCINTVALTIQNLEDKQETFSTPFSRLLPQQTVVFLVEYQNWQQNGGKMVRKNHFQNTSIQISLNNDLQPTCLAIHF